jgi:hypothetical protein
MITPEELRELDTAPSKSVAESERERLIRRMKGAAEAGRCRVGVNHLSTELRRELSDAGFKISESTVMMDYCIISWEAKS